jgi:hypothetical protein
MVESVNRSLHLLLADIAQVHALWEILPQKTVAVFVQAALP